MNMTQRIQSTQEKITAVARLAGRNSNEITLCGATKTQTGETISAAIAAGLTVCGENRVQELVAHLEENAYQGAEVHFIGRLQTNKVRQVVGQVALIHSVDSLRLAQAIEKQAEKLDIVQDILIQVNIGREDSKGGFFPEETLEICQQVAAFPHVRLRGLMAIPPIAMETGGNCRFFSEMRELYIDIREKMVDNQSSIDCLSMGMSGDYADAIAHGATLVRVGTALFGARPTPQPAI